jgi:hypothetical protein
LRYIHINDIANYCLFHQGFFLTCFCSSILSCTANFLV